MEFMVSVGAFMTNNQRKINLGRGAEHHPQL